jgi:hypothetical protein
MMQSNDSSGGGPNTRLRGREGADDRADDDTLPLKSVKYTSSHRQSHSAPRNDRDLLGCACPRPLPSQLCEFRHALAC